MSKYIDVDKAIKALLDALYDYENRTKENFLHRPNLRIIDWYEHRIFVHNMNDIDRKTILNMDTADVRENVHGEWILDDSVFGFPKWNCSKCEGEGRGDYLFCPKCGADMRKGEKVCLNG